jgi:hypothetical protein
VLDTGDEPNISSRTIDIMNWSRQQVDEILGFENAHLISTENFDDLPQPQRWLHLESINELVVDEFDNVMALEGFTEEGFFTEELDPFWAQWASV